MSKRAEGISVVMPTFNEERFLNDALCSALTALRNTSQKYEVLVCDGGSSDKTLLIARKFLCENVHLYENMGNCPSSMNEGINRSKFDKIAKIDGHGFVDINYFTLASKTLAKYPNVALVGGPVKHHADSNQGRANICARTSKFGAGNGPNLMRNAVRFTDSVQCGVYRSSIFSEVGFFDREMQYAEDEELNFRIVRSGAEIISDNKIIFNYHSRENLFGLFKQYHNYGSARVKMLWKHPNYVKIRHLVPAIHIMFLCGMFIPKLTVISSLYLTSYAICFLMISIFYGFKNSLNPFRIFLSFNALHLGYGSGFFKGLVLYAAK